MVGQRVYKFSVVLELDTEFTNFWLLSSFSSPILLEPHTPSLDAVTHHTFYFVTDSTMSKQILTTVDTNEKIGKYLGQHKITESAQQTKWQFINGLLPHANSLGSMWIEFWVLFDWLFSLFFGIYKLENIQIYSYILINREIHFKTFLTRYATLITGDRGRRTNISKLSLTSLEIETLMGYLAQCLKT